MCANVSGQQKKGPDLALKFHFEGTVKGRKNKEQKVTLGMEKRITKAHNADNVFYGREKSKKKQKTGPLTGM